jgi:uncharacterized membrane protein YfbV (UPF0208 family)
LPGKACVFIQQGPLERDRLPTTTLSGFMVMPVVVVITMLMIMVILMVVILTVPMVVGMVMGMPVVVSVFIGMAANGDLPAESASAFFAHIKKSPPN